MSIVLSDLSELSTVVIATLALIHLLLFVGLWQWARRDLRTIAASLDDVTRGLRHRSILDANYALSDQVEAFLADLSEVLDDPQRRDERTLLRERLSILDEKRRYLASLSFETVYTACRTMIEAYPLAGVLGTILAIGAALQSETTVAAGSAVQSIVTRFGDAIWSTFAGLMAAIILMFFNSLLETPFSRLSENRRHVRELMARAKRELALSGGAHE